AEVVAIGSGRAIVEVEEDRNKKIETEEDRSKKIENLATFIRELSAASTRLLLMAPLHDEDELVKLLTDFFIAIQAADDDVDWAHLARPVLDKARDVIQRREARVATYASGDLEPSAGE